MSNFNFIPFTEVFIKLNQNKFFFEFHYSAIDHITDIISDENFTISFIDNLMSKIYENLILIENELNISINENITLDHCKDSLGKFYFYSSTLNFSFN
jgi:hypothetical protein